MKTPVVQLWVFDLPWKMQTVMIQGMRAPDTHFCINTKIVSRWIRSIVLNNADKNHSFMCRRKRLPKWEKLENELNYCSVHFFTHFLYALEIIGYKHPEEDKRTIAMGYYENLVNSMSHLNIETEKELDLRLADMEDVPLLFELFRAEFEQKERTRLQEEFEQKLREQAEEQRKKLVQQCKAPDSYIRR